jgi:hypothetical protein
MRAASCTMLGLVQAGHHPRRPASVGPFEEAGVPTSERTGISSGEAR